MTEVRFSEVAVGQHFFHGSTEWVKEDRVRINCCKFTNAHAVTQPNRKLGFKPNDVVSVPSEG